MPCCRKRRFCVQGPRSDRVRLEEQMRRLFAARVSFEGSFERDGAVADVTEYMPIARRTVHDSKAAN